MNIVKLFLIIGAILVVLAPLATPALAQTTFTWDDDSGDGEWSTGINWSPTGPPQAGDTAIIGDGIGVFIVEISAQDAVCKVLNLRAGSTLTIDGKKLQLGNLGDIGTDPPIIVTSAIDGTIKFKKNGTNKAVMEIGHWVKFEGGGWLDGSKANGTNYEGVIQRHANGIGIIVDEGMHVVGSLELLGQHRARQLHQHWIQRLRHVSRG